MVLELKTADEGTKAEFSSQVQNFKRTVANLKADYETLQQQRNKDDLFDSVCFLFYLNTNVSSLMHIVCVCPCRERAVKIEGECKTHQVDSKIKTK